MRIKKEALELILGASRSYHPQEFGGMLRGKGDLIEEALMIPATRYGDGFVETRMDMAPMDKSVIGSFHSHPGRDNRPSKADLAAFNRKGIVHLIVRHPYKGIEDVAAYDREGTRIGIEVYYTQTH